MKNFLPKLGRSGLVALFLFVGLPLFSQAPANDNCADAIPISIGEMVDGSSENATFESDVAYAGTDCDAPGISDINDIGVWYSFVAPAAPVNIALNGDFNVELAVLAGDCQSLDCVAFDNNGGPGENSLITNLQLIEGDTYLIYAEGGGGQTGMLMVEVCGNELICNDVEVFLDVNGSATITAMQVAMNTCDPSGITLSQSDFTCDDLGDNIVTVTQGNATCDATVTVVDNSPPVIDCATNFPDVIIDCRENLPPVNFDDVAAVTTDNCATFGGDDQTGILSALTFIPGNTGCPGDTVRVTRTFFIQDTEGNQAQCMFRIDIISDNGPTITAPADSLIDCGVTPVVSADDADASFECSFFAGVNNSVSVSGPVFAGDPDVPGTTLTYLYTATDGCGRMASAEQVFTVQDTMAPVLVCRDTTIALDATGGNGFAPGDLVEVTDNCAPADVAVGNPLQVFSCDQLGANTFTETRTDPSGNSASCEVTVTVIDTLMPVIMCQDITVELDEMGNASIATDGNAGPPVTEVTGSLDGTDPQFARPAGNGTTCTTTAAADHFYDVFNFTIDAEDMYTFSMPNIIGPDFYFLLYEGGFDPANPCVNFIIGDDDANGTEPEIMIQLTLVPGDYTLVTTSFGGGQVNGAYTYSISSENGGNAFSSSGNATSAIDGGATDNCAGVLTFSESMTEFTCDNLGPNIVTLTVTDASGNVSTCEATVTVEDNIAPVVTGAAQLIILSDDNIEQTLTQDDLLPTISDNCDDMPVVVFDRSLTFTGADIGINVVTATVTDASGNATTLMINVVVDFEQPNLACIGEINLTLNDDCQGLLIPRMVLTGNVGLLDAFNLEITVMDNDPSNGPIVDGCGSFQYMISDASGTAIAPVEGFTGILAEENWTVASTGAEAAATFTATSLEVTSGVAGDGDFSNSDDITVSYQFAEAGTVSFDADYFVETEIIEDIIIVDFDGNIIFQSISDEDTTGPTESGNFSVLEEVPAGATLMVMIEGDDFTTSGNVSRITLTNFSFTPLSSPLALDFETCWGIVNAEDKTPPAIVSTPDDVDLLCVDLDGNNLSTLPNTTDKCYRVSSATGATIPGSMAPALRARLLAGGLTPLVPTFTDGCTNEIEVCVNDVVVTGNDPSCDDVVITRTFTATEIAVCASAAGEANESVVTSFELTFERPTLADLSADNIDNVVEYDRCGMVNPTQADYPAPRPGDFPFLALGDRTFPLQDGEAVCNIGVTYTDGSPIVTCPFTYKFIRTYTVIDWCAPGDIRTFVQVVKVGDTTAPVFTGPSAPTNAAGDLVFGTNAGNICAAYLRLDDVSAVDNCSGTNVSISAAIYPGGNLNGTPIGSFVVVPGGTPELSSAIPAGRHLLRYSYEDECGNADFRDYFFVVEDQTPPVAICEDGLNISIAGGSNNGFAVLTAANIDNGSYDDCSGITRAIARVNANDLAIGGYADQITLTCADIGIVRVGLRVTDALGNENFCWLDVLVEDKLIPTCIAPGDVVITCDEYNTTLPADIMDASNETLDALFGAAAGVDNCGVTITQSISGDVNSCGVGSFVRTFVATDDAGFTNSNSCRQNIRVDGVHDYRLTFPTDESSDCAIVPEYDGIMAEELACDLITTTTDVDTLRTLDAGDECFKLRITYDVVNWCEYNSFGEPYLVPRDGDGVNNRQRLPRDLEADVLYLNVLPGATTTTTDDDRAFMTLFTDRVFSPNAPQNDQPVDDNLLSDGDDNDYGDNDVDSRGFFRYVQFIKIYDEVAPEITFTEPAECFAGNNEDCSGTVELTFTALDACSDAVVGVELDADFDPAVGFVRTADITGSASNDGEGNFTVNLTNIPVGEHAIRVRASDGCGNFDVQIIEFCVAADRTPTPICIQTLTVTLMNDGNGGGIAAIWASDFIASPIVDCFGNPVTKYSLYRTSDAEENGFAAEVGQLGIDDINCADVGDLAVRVYAFDDNGSTPDFCEVVVEVQDNEPWCGGSTGDLSGLVTTPADEALAGVMMTLTGGMDATTTTDATGAFEFRNLAFGGDYTVQPSYDAPFSNRDVKTSDLVAAISDILGTQSFDSPYDYIAADVNRDGEHDVRDVVMSSRAILGITNGYAAGNWSFTTADAVININNPYGEAFPEVYNVNDLQGSFRAADFVAIMMGDLVSGNGRSAQTLRTEDVRLEAGQTHTVVLDGAHLAGFQGTIELAAGLELVSADYAGEGGMNLNRAAEGLIAVALRNAASLTLEVRATEAGLLSELIGLSDAIAVREGVAANGTSNGLNLAFNGSALAPATALNALYQNTPNPVMDMTMISFELAQAGAATLTVQDAAGRLILTRQLEAVAGLNQVELMDIKATGVLTYTLTSGDFIASRKMVVVK